VPRGDRTGAARPRSRAGGRARPGTLPPVALSTKDRALVEAATEAILRLYEPDRHHVAAALRMRDGRVHTAVHLDTYVGACAVCAEAAVLAKAASEGERDVDAIAAVRWRGVGRPVVVSPCGRCRELLVDYGDPWVVHAGADGAPVRTRASRLLPAPYRRREEPRPRR
jgi:cytidine deaminase